METKVLSRKLSFSIMMVLSLTFSSFMNSCSNSKDITLSEEEQLKLQEEALLTSAENSDTDYLLPDGEYSFIYDGKKYTYTLSNGEVSCNDETKKVIDYLQGYGDKLITAVTENNTIVYYTSEKELSHEYINSRAEEVKYRATSLTLYRNKNYWGSREHYRYDSRNGVTKTNTGVSWGVSSFKAKIDHLDSPLDQVIRVELYDQNDLKGRMVVFTIHGNELSKSNLKDVPLYPGSSENWNDRVKSLSLS